MYKFTVQGGKSMQTLEFINWLTLFWQQWPQPNMSCRCRCITVRRISGPFHFTKLFLFSSILEVSGMNLSLYPCHSISIKLRSRIYVGHPRKCIFFRWSHSVVDLLLCIGSSSCWITDLILSFDWWTYSQDEPGWGFEVSVQCLFSSLHKLLRNNATLFSSIKYFVTNAKEHPGAVLQMCSICLLFFNRSGFFHWVPPWTLLLFSFLHITDFNLCKR